MYYYRVKITESNESILRQKGDSSRRFGASHPPIYLNAFKVLPVAYHNTISELDGTQ